MSARDLPVFSTPADFTAAHLAREYPQPTVPADLQCLHTGYPHGPLFLDLYGTWDREDGHIVETAMLTGDTRRVCLAEFLGRHQLEQMGHALDRARWLAGKD